MARNIEAALKKSITATFCARGVTEAEAARLASVHAEAAKTTFDDALKGGGGATEGGYEHAFAAVSTWASQLAIA